MAYHLSIFVENQPGKLERITKILQDNNINLRAVSVASAGEFGIVKILVNDPEATLQLLKSQHITVSKRRILIALIDDQPGALHTLLTTLTRNHINVEDCYGFVLEEGRTAAIVVEVEKYPEAEATLAAAGIRVLPDDKNYFL